MEHACQKRFLALLGFAKPRKSWRISCISRILRCLLSLIPSPLFPLPHSPPKHKGMSTGGFTDCLLQRGATRVYGVDVGYGQVSGRCDPTNLS
jgi:hypothetical protein